RGARRAFWRVVELVQHVRHTGTLRGTGLRWALNTALRRSPPWLPDLPNWIDEDFARRTDLRDRWWSGWQIINGRFGIQCQLTTPWLAGLFEDCEVLRLPLIVRHPFYDVRLAELLVSLPRCMTQDKRILRDAMRGKLPEEIRTRP